MDEFNNDGKFDSDLEARLYGEIYHSNDTFSEPPLRFSNNLTLDKRVNQSYIPQNNYSNDHHAQNNRLNSTPYLWMTHSSFPNPFYDHRSSSSTSNRRNLPSYERPTSCPRSYDHQRNLSNVNYTSYLRNHYYSPFENDYRRPSYKRTQEYQHVVTSYKSRKNNYPRNFSEKSSTSRYQRSNRSRSSRTRALPRVSSQKANNSNQKSVNSVTKLLDNVSDGNFENSHELEVSNSTNTSAVISENIDSNNDDKNETADNEANSIYQYSDTASKYDVKNKQKQVELSDIKNMDNDIISCSDSEESIFEVPVPPKPKPPLINLQESDDSSGAEEIEETEKQEGEENFIIIDNVDKSTSDLSPVILDSNVQKNPQSVNFINTDNVEKESTNINIDDDNIILNCAALLNYASSLDDIRRIRETAVTSDDSMTDSEALNWGTIGGQIIQDKQPISDDDSNHGPFNVNYFEKSNNNEKVQDISKSVRHDKPPTKKTTQASSRKQSISEPLQSQELPSCSKDNQDINQVVNCSTEENTVEIESLPSTSCSEKNKKRPYKLNQSESDVNIDSYDHKEASTSNKRRRSSIKSSAEMSFEEYVFQPMSEKMKEYYDTFRGEEFMDDVLSIQSQMPRNPSRWAILDIDLYGPRRWDRQLRCTICQHYGHKRERCPNYKPIIVCYMCGENGHVEPRCPYKMCLTCGTKYSTYRKTCEKCRSLVCSTCKAQGHLSTNCPDLWRRFHQTTNSYTVNVSLNPEVLLKTPNKLVCCNCTKRGHESTTCQRLRWSQHFPTPRFVTNYDKPPFYIPNIEALTSSKPSEILYHETNFNSNIIPVEWITEKIHPHTISGVSFTPNEGYLPTPVYLKHHIPIDVYYDITISRLPNSSDCVFLVKSTSEELVCILKKLIIQWLQRTPEDRLLMDSTNTLPRMQVELIDCLKAKWKLFKKLGFQKSSHWVNTVERRGKKAERELMEIEATEKLSAKKMKRQKVMKKRLIATKRRLLAFTYSLPSFPEAVTVMEQFTQFIDKLKKHPVLASVPSDLYLNATWYNFELFVPHLSQYILVAFQKENRRQLNKFNADKSKPKKKKVKLNKNHKIQEIDLTETDPDPSINIIETNDRVNKTPEHITLKMNSPRQKHQFKTRIKKRTLKAISNNTNSVEDGKQTSKYREQIKRASEILRFVKEMI